MRPADESEVSALTRQADVSDAVARVLTARGVGADGAELFLRPTLKALMPDPRVFAGMDDAAARIAAAVKNGERIAIFGDYDVDGATSSALLMRFFRAIGADVITYIPDRRAEGYGPNEPALRKLHGEGVTLVITVDCGITSYAPLAAVRELGLDVVVVDHHKAEAVLPAAAAVVNPNRLDDTSHQGHLAAVGVAFLVAVAVNRSLREAGWYGAKIAEPDLRQWLDLVALGTVCDVVPLHGLNRAFVVQGLNVLARGANAGLAALSKVARIDTRPTAFHLGFLLGPRVNAGGRVGQADLGTRLLSTDDADEAAALALRLDEFNAARKEIEAAVLQEAIEQVETKASADDAVLIAAGAGWHPGVIGIVAGRLKERYDRPAVVIALEAGMSKGSGRSVAGIDLGKAVIAAREAGLLINGGGHAMAAGFTVAEENLDAFSAFLQRAVREQQAGEPMLPRLTLDGAVAVSAVTTRLIEELSCVAPFGAGNEEPRFAVVDAEVIKATVVGSGHVSCILAGRGGGRLKAIAFNSVDSELGHALLTGVGQRLHFAGVIRANTWQGRTTAELVVDDAAVPVT